jgi:3-oxoacyl-[acyl-carrier protein] reductase
LAGEGAHVIAADIDGVAARRTAETIQQSGGQATAIDWDLADLSVVKDNVASILARHGSIDILVNNTGGPPPTPVSGQSPDVWSKYFDSMVKSVIAVTDEVLPTMRERGWGRIITSTSSGVISPIPNLGISNTLRMALVGWSKTLSREIGRSGITANIVLPGRVATGRITFLDEQKAKREDRSVEDVMAESTGSIPLGRYGKPTEYGDVVCFLASEKASYITGSVIRIDGGLIASV